MFEVGQRVIYGTHGVCEIVKIDTVDIPGVDAGRMYYHLSSVLNESSLMYAPVDNPKLAIRLVMTREEALSLIDEMPSIDLLTVEIEKQRENIYKESMRSLDNRKIVSLLKTVRAREEERIAAGKRMTAVDERYMKQAQTQLYSEMAIALEIDRDQVEDFILSHIS